MPANKRESSRKNKKDGPRVSLREKMIEMLELPKDVILNIPRLTMVGNGNLVIENYKGVIEYDSSRIRINTGKGVIRITGERLVIKEITSEDIMVEGQIHSLEFIE